MKKHILLVEDSEDDVVLLKRALKTSGVEVLLDLATTGREAIEYLSRILAEGADPLQRPRLVLLDLKLPEVLGLDVLKWIRSQPAFQSLIVVILTTSRHRSDLERAYGLGANSYLVKPATLDDLQRMMRTFGDYWFAYNELPEG